MSLFIPFSICATYSTLSGTSISIQALDQKHIDAEGTEIWIIGVEVDGVFYEPDKLFPSGWIKKDGQIGWKAYDQPAGLTAEITGKLPIGQEGQLLLETNRWRGIAQVTIDGVSQQIDCYLPQEQSGSLKIILPSAVSADTISPANFFYGIFGIVFLISSVGMILLKSKEKTPIDSLSLKRLGQGREIWSDLLRIVSTFAVVVIHATGVLYAQYEPTQRWYFGLYVNAITRFAVPCFMLLSGAYTIASPQTVRSVWKKRISRVLVPLLFWSTGYILLRVYGQGQNLSVFKQIILIPLQHQNNHLWFIYQLIGFYLLLPILSKLYQALNEQYRWYFVSATLLGPSLVDYIFGILMPNAPEFLSIKWSHIGLAEVGLFFLGCILLDFLKKKPVAPLWGALIAFVGFAGVVLGNYMVSVNQEKSFWKFFDQIRFPTVIFAVGVFVLFYGLEEYLHRMPEWVMQLIQKGSQLSMGVYFVHRIPLILLPGGVAPKVIISFVVSYAFCYLLAQIPYLRSYAVKGGCPIHY